MELTDEELAMLNGQMGQAVQWAISHQITVGRFLGARDMVAVDQAHIMCDPEAVGKAGLHVLESLAEQGGKVRIPTLSDPRGLDLTQYEPLGQTEDMANRERRLTAAMRALGVLMTDSCIIYQSVMPPTPEQHVAFGDTGVVIYANSACGARSNFEGGPSALAAALTGRTPRYGLHLAENRRATRRFRVMRQPRDLSGWGLLGAVIGKLSGSYWEIPAIEGLERGPRPDEMKHMGASMASYGSIPLFHLIGVTPEAPDLHAVGADKLPITELTGALFDLIRIRFEQSGDSLDVVVFAAPQLSLLELQKLANLSNGQQFRVPVIACTAPQVHADAERLGLVQPFRDAGGRLLVGTCFYNGFAREVGVANGWTNVLTNSMKLLNILGGYGYQPALASMETCIASAIKGEIVS